MNTKTMRLPPRRSMLPSASDSGSGAANKRKERDDGFERATPKPSSTTISTTTTKLHKPDKPRVGLEPRACLEPISINKGSNPSNQLLAGYLAHEFLTRGTLFGQPWSPTQAEGPTASEKKKGRPSGSEEGEAAGTSSRRAEQPPPPPEEEEKYERYVQVAGLLKGEGAHLLGVVNPTQLAGFLQL